MKILAIEHSTVNGSLALLDNDTLLEEISWKRESREPGTLPQDIDDLLKKHNLSFTDIDTFAVGTGPGIYSNLRISLSTANGLALPDKKKVYGISSAFAMAFRYGNEHNLNEVSVIGDARRNRLWYVKFTVTPPDFSTTDDDYKLIRIDKLPDYIEKNETVITADRESLHTPLADICTTYPNIVQTGILPSATDTGRIAYLQATANILPAFPVSPIYIHPPVFVKPRFK